MKKQSIVFGALLVLTSGLYAITGQEVINQLSPAANNFGQNALNPSKSVSEQNASLVAWEKELAKAKVFVIENSKNLVGVKDSDIINAMSAVEKASMDIINITKITRGISAADGLRAQQNQLANVQRNLRTATDKLSRASMTLANKKEAKNVVTSIGRFLEQVIQAVDNVIAAKIASGRPALPPRGSNIPAPSRDLNTPPRDLPPMFPGN
ncbi:MAG TPA: hypothetical protein VJJ26_04460 [Candidatus Babeliales bacterium]|nr:hypothetical protein [Candidatus Babeliales bacterium]